MLATFFLTLALQSPVPELTSRAQALSPDGKLFAFSVSDGTLHVVSLPEGKTLRVLDGLPETIDDITFSPDGALTACIASDGTIRVFLPTGDAPPRTIAAGARLVSPQWRSRTLDFVDSGTKLFLAGGTERARLLETSSGSAVREWTLADESKSGALSPITASCTSADGMHVALGDFLGRFAVFSARTGKLEFGLRQVPPRVNALAFDKPAHRLAVGGGDCKVRIVTLDAPQDALELSHCDQDLFGDLAIGSVCFSSDGKSLLASSFSFWEVRLWDLETRKPRWAFDYSGGAPGALRPSFTDGEKLIVNSHLGGVFDALSGKQLRTLEDATGYFRSAGERSWSLSPGKIRVFDPRDGKLVCELPLATSAPAPR